MAKSPRSPPDQSSRSSHEPPAKVTPEGVEAHPHTTGHRLTDITIAGAAIFISLLSLLIAFKHGMIMKDLVAASSWPLLQFTSNNTDENADLELTLDVQNAGVGPAIVKRFSVQHGGKSYTNQFDLLRDCCGYLVTTDDPTRSGRDVPLVRFVEGQVIRSGESITYINMPFSDRHADAWRKLDKARFELKFDTCYCSVLGDCWQSDLVGVEPKPVKKCAPQTDARN